MAFYCETDNDFISFIRCIFRILKYFKDMRFLKLTFLCIMGTTAITAARPASPVATCIPQSNGDCLTILQYGDEHYHYATTIDGYLVVRDSINDYVYADANATASGRKAHNADKRSTSDKSFLKGLNQREIIGKHIKNQTFRYPEQRDLLSNFQHKAQENRKALYRPKPLTFTKGENRFPVFLVSTADRDFGDTAWYRRSLNEVGFSEDGHYGSVHDYFLVSSDSLFNPTFDVYPVKIDLPSTEAGDAGGEGEGKFVKAAIDAAIKDMGDLSKYDKDGDKYIDGFGVVLAGTEAGSDLWGHMYYYTTYTNPELYTGYTGGWWGSRNHSTSNNKWGNDYNGYKFDRYLLIAEMSDPMAYIKSGHNGIGVFIHEFSHILGLPDFYTPDENDSEPYGPYEIMAQGMYNGTTRSYQMGRCPPKYSAFERESMGWMTIPDLKPSVELYALEMIDANKAYSVTNPKNNDEYYVIEYRPRIGWDKAVSDTANMGILIWHIDYDKRAWEYYPNQDKEHYGITAALNLSKNKTFKDFKFGEVGVYNAIKEGEDKVCFATKDGIEVKCTEPEPESSSAVALSSSAELSSAAASSSSAALNPSTGSSSSKKTSSHTISSSASSSSTRHRSSASKNASKDTTLFAPNGTIQLRTDILVLDQELIVKTDVRGLKHVRILDALGSVVAKYDFDTEKMQIPIARTMRRGTYFVQVYTQQKTLVTTKINAK